MKKHSSGGIRPHELAITALVITVLAAMTVLGAIAAANRGCCLANNAATENLPDGAAYSQRYNYGSFDKTQISVYYPVADFPEPPNMPRIYTDPYGDDYAYAGTEGPVETDGHGECWEIVYREYYDYRGSRR